MKKTIFLKSIFLLCTLLAGVLSAHAEDYDYEWAPISLSNLQSGDVVLLVDKGKNFALPNDDSSFKGVPVTISDGNIADGDLSNIQWTLTKNNDGTVTFKKGNAPLSVKSNFDLIVGQGTRSDFTYNNGLLGIDYSGTAGVYCIKWKADKAVFESLNSGNTDADFTFYKKVVKNYVKWKKVPNDLLPMEGEVVVVVDLNTESAMSNDKADKDPDAVAMKLNDDKDRILGDVAEKVQWTFKIPSDGNTTGPIFQFMTTDGNDYLYADSKGLKVGDDSDKDRDFTMSSIDDVWYLKITTGEKDYLAGVEESMFSNSWKLKELKDGKPDDKVKNTRFAFFKKVENEQKVVNIELAEYYNYDLNENYAMSIMDFMKNVTITGAEKSEIQWSSSNEAVATINEQGMLELKKRGTTVITASVDENLYHDKASAKCKVMVDNSGTEDLGTINLPLTVAEAKDLAETGKVEHDGTVYLTWEEGVNYYIKGKVSKVNSGMLAMFGDMDLGDMMGGSGSGGMDFDDMMDDMDFDMDSMGDMGFDMSSMGIDMSSFFGSSEGVTYYISDDGTKDNQLKVVNGRGVMTSNNGCAVEYDGNPNLSPGDCVVVCGPLVYSEDTSMFSSLMGGSSDEPKKSGKVDEMNYLAIYDPTLLVEDKEIYVNKTLDGSVSNNPLDGNDLYHIDNEFNLIYNSEQKITNDMRVEAPTYKSSDEEIAKWDEDTKKIIGVQEGTAKITVKVKVILQEADDNADPKVEEKSYTMKRKFKLTVKTRDLDPAGYYDGDYVLTTNTSDLKDGTRLLLLGTRVKDDKATDYIMGENNSMMGGGKSGSKYEFEEGDDTKEKIPCEDVPKGTLEVVLEKAEDGSSWYLNVGEDENGEKLYLYASDTKEETQDPEESQGSGFNFDEMMEMFMPSSGLKVGTKEAVTADSCKATIAIENGIATIGYTKTEGKKNTIVLTSSFDMGSMMNMFGGNEGGDEGGDEGGTGTSTFDMGSFDMFMASFNTKKPADIDGEKAFMPCIYRFVPDETFNISIGETEWKTIVTYKDVAIPDNVDAYVIVRVVQGQGENVSKAILKNIEYRKLKGGEPYLLHSTSPADSYTLTLLTDEESEELSDMLTSEQSEDSYQKNMLLVSTRKTAGEKGNTSVYVLADKSKGVGFYRWTGGELGKGRVYLPVDATQASANEFYSFFENDNQSDAIKEIDRSELNDAPCYDLQGRRVKTLTKGIYIVNGHKVIIK